MFYCQALGKYYCLLLSVFILIIIFNLHFSAIADDVLREHTTALTNAITPGLNEVAAALQEKNLISLKVKCKILQTKGVSPNDKAEQLVNNLQLYLRGNLSPDKYLIDLCQVLHSQGDNTLREIANSIQQNLGKQIIIL